MLHYLDILCNFGIRWLNSECYNMKIKLCWKLTVHIKLKTFILILLFLLQERRTVDNVSIARLHARLWKCVRICVRGQSSHSQRSKVWVRGGPHYHQTGTWVEHFQVCSLQKAMKPGGFPGGGNRWHGPCDYVLFPKYCIIYFLIKLLNAAKYKPGHWWWNASLVSQWQHSGDRDRYQPGHHPEPPHQSHIQEHGDGQRKCKRFPRAKWAFRLTWGQWTGMTISRLFPSLQSPVSAAAHRIRTAVLE